MGAIMGESKLRLAIRAVLGGGTLVASLGTANAQTTPPAVPPAETADIQEVVVTGSRIQSTNLVSISPVTTVTATEIAQTGATRIEDVLNSLPSIYATQNSAVSNGSDGTATVNLHDLGVTRTLVLQDGRRLGPGAPDGRNYADLDQIPVELVERVEVLTGGASSTYGAAGGAGGGTFI